MGRGLFFSRGTSLALTRFRSPREGFTKTIPFVFDLLFNLTYENAGRGFEQFPFLAEAER